MLDANETRGKERRLAVHLSKARGVATSDLSNTQSSELSLELLELLSELSLLLVPKLGSTDLG